MADVRCPMCGKTNPADLDECQYCQARLRPIWDSTPAGGASEPAGDQGSGLPDWLRSLRTPEEPESEQPAPESESRDAVPDWLGDLRKQPAEPGGQPSEEISDDLTSQPEDNASNWLQSILAEDDLAEDELFSKQMTDAFRLGDADWFPQADSTPIEEGQPQESSETLDWLSELEQAAPDLSSSTGQDWYSPPDSRPSESVEPLPDWLVKAESDYPQGEDQQADVPSGLAEEPAEEVELPSWLQQAASSIQETAEPVDEPLPDWTRLEPAQSAAPQPVADDAMDWLAGGEEELPAWLFIESPAVESVEPQAELTEFGDLGLPGLQAPTAQPVEEAQPVEPVGEVLPDWLATEEEVPDWLKPPLETPELEETSLPSAEEPMPEGLFFEEPLLAELEQATEAQEPETPAEEVSPWLVGAGVAAAGLGFSLEEEQPEGDLGWLSELETTYGSLSPNAPETSAAAPGEAEGFGLEPVGAIPVWLSKASEEEEQVLEEGVEGEAELKPAELPSWLQAMRPVGVTAAAAGVIGESEPQQIEGAGPLAGLRGALPAEPDVSQVQKPPVYSIKLQVTDAQQLQAELLRGLIDSEGQPQALPGRPVISSQQVLRLILAVLLIFPLLFVLLTGVPQLSLPAATPEVEAVVSLIDGLQSGAPVLLAVDYQPGFSGEMDAVTSPVVQHLFARGAHLALVSTVSTGPVQADHLLTQALSSSAAPLQGLASTTNLGYIPGGATGLLAFAQSPRTVIPTNLRGERVWDVPALQPVDTLDKFAMIIVSTENPDIARYWIEQVQPQLGSTPLVMVLSAQAEPIVKPYYQASPSQVNGLVGGLAGGVAYQVRSGASGTATRFWSPFGVGALIAVVLMVLAGLVNVISAQVARQKEKAGGKK